jgi:hypothetical protein
MWAACRRFLERLGTDGLDGIHHGNGWGVRSWTFGRALGQLRRRFGIHVAKIVAAFRLDVEDRLASILPAIPMPTQATMTGCLARCTSSRGVRSTIRTGVPCQGEHPRTRRCLRHRVGGATRHPQLGTARYTERYRAVNIFRICDLVWFDVYSGAPSR